MLLFLTLLNFFYQMLYALGQFFLCPTIPLVLKDGDAFREIHCERTLPLSWYHTTYLEKLQQLCGHSIWKLLRDHSPVSSPLLMKIFCGAWLYCLWGICCQLNLPCFLRFLCIQFWVVYPGFRELSAVGWIVYFSPLMFQFPASLYLEIGSVGGN